MGESRTEEDEKQFFWQASPHPINQIYSRLCFISYGRQRKTGWLVESNRWKLKCSVELPEMTS